MPGGLMRIKKAGRTIPMICTRLACIDIPGFSQFNYNESGIRQGTVRMLMIFKRNQQ